MIKFGEIYIDNNFKFHDGTTKRKWFFVLNTPKEQEPWIVALITSKVNKFKNIESGCNEHYQNYLIDESFDDFENFKCRSVILLDDLYIITFAEMLSKKFNNNLKLQGTLEKATVQSILNCLGLFKYTVKSKYQKFCLNKGYYKRQVYCTSTLESNLTASFWGEVCS